MFSDPNFLMTLLVGGGIITMLFSINHQLGGIKKEMGHMSDGLKDHEHRIRSLEKRND